MQLTNSCFLLLICASVGFAQWFRPNHNRPRPYHHPWSSQGSSSWFRHRPSPWFRPRPSGGRECCAPPYLSLEEKLQRLLKDNNRSPDGDFTVVNFQDIQYDLNNNYDKNRDGEITEQEFVRRWSCAYGDSVFFARYAFALIGRGQTVIKAQDFNVTALVQGLSQDAFVDRNRERYTSFGENDCVNTNLTTEQKLVKIIADNNFNQDDVVTYQDLEYDVNNRYDTNNDGFLSQAEWVARWVCAYGDTVNYAVFAWNQLTQGAEQIPTNGFQREPFIQGLPLQQFRAMNQQRYEAYANQTSSN